MKKTAWILLSWCGWTALAAGSGALSGAVGSPVREGSLRGDRVVSSARSGQSLSSPPKHVQYALRRVEGTLCHVLTINLNEPAVRVSIETARALPHGDESFAELLARSHPVAAINGTFFGKDNLRPIGDLVIQGKLRHSGRMGPVLAITPQNQALIRRVEWGRSQDWSAYDTVLGCGPTLLRAGEIDVQPDLERFRDPHVLGMSNRSAAGLTPANKLLLVSIPSAVSLTKLAEIMRELGCQEAMNLDGGASMAMYYRGKTILPAGRRLTNILVVYQNPEN